MKTNKIKSFTDLLTWKESHKLVLMIYNVTSNFPKTETYSLVDQMRRAALSITSNIAEGFGRQSYKEKVHFYYTAQGSISELKNQILVARDVGYLTSEKVFNELVEQANASHKLLIGLTKKTRSFLSQKSKIKNP